MFVLLQYLVLSVLFAFFRVWKPINIYLIVLYNYK